MKVYSTQKSTVMIGEWVLGQTAWFRPQLCPSLVLWLFTGCFVCKMGVKLICAVVQILYNFRCCPCSGLFLYQHQTVMFIVTDGFNPVHPHLKCIVDVRIRLAVAHFVRLEKPLMACVYNCRPYWLIHYPENPELAAMKSCISNPYWTSGCCRVLFNDVGDGQIYGRTLHLEVRNCSSSAVCSHCPLSLDSLRNSGFSPSPSHWKHVLLGWTVFLCSWLRCCFWKCMLL